MDIKLCINSSENAVINKKITIKNTVPAIVKGSLSTENPVFILSYDGELKNVINYVVVDELSRSYFITDIITLTGSRYELHCSVDVLESFKQDILKLSCIIDKQQNVSKSNLYLDDGSYKMLNKQFNRVINFPNGFNNNGEYILITAGGGGSIV